MSNIDQVSSTASSGLGFYTLVSALGFGLIATAGIVTLGPSLASGDGGFTLIFGAVFIVLGLLMAGLVWRGGRMALIIAAILSFLLLALLGPFSLFTLGHPESAPDFIPTVLLLAGALLGFIGSVVALVQARRHTSRPRASRAERFALGIGLGIVALAVTLSGVLTLADQTVVSAEAKADAIEMQLKNFEFTPSILHVRSGENVRLVIKNDDPTLHTLTLPQAGVDVSVPPGSEKIVEFKAPAPGTYQWYCIPHASSDGSMRTGMVGTLLVE